MEVVIVGNGPAGVAAAEAIRETGIECSVTVISKEAEPFYSPCPLAEYVEGSVTRSSLFMRDGDFYRRNRIDLLAGAAAVSLDPSRRRIGVSRNGRVEQITYDRLLLASGAVTAIPPVPGLAGGPGVFTLKTLGDADAILDGLGGVRRAAVIGSGFIGLEAAQALVRRGVQVTVVEAMGQVLPQMLDAEFASRVQERLELFDVEVLLGNPVQAVNRGPSGVESVVAGGREIECQMVVCATGVRPDLSWMEGSGLVVDRGVVVNDLMETSVDGVYAAGDVIRAPDWSGHLDLLPNWPNAVASGRIAGLNIAGQRRSFAGLIPVNVVRIFDQPVSSFGARHGEQVLTAGEGERARRLFLEGGRIAGGQFLGDVSGSGVFLEMMRKQVDAGFLEGTALSGRRAVAAMLPKPPRVRSLAG